MNLLEASVLPVAAEGIYTWAWLMIALPALGAAILLLAGKATDAWGHWLGTLMPIASFAVAAGLFGTMLGADEGERAVDLHLWTWIASGN